MKKSLSELWIFTNLFMPQPNDVPSEVEGQKSVIENVFWWFFQLFLTIQVFLWNVVQQKERKEEKNCDHWKTVSKGGRASRWKIGSKFRFKFYANCFSFFYSFYFAPKRKVRRKTKDAYLSTFIRIFDNFNAEVPYRIHTKVLKWNFSKLKWHNF